MGRGRVREIAWTNSSRRCRGFGCRRVFGEYPIREPNIVPSRLHEFQHVVRPGPLVPLLVAGMIGCSSSSIFGVEAEGEAARISWLFSEGVGGEGFETSMEID